MEQPQITPIQQVIPPEIMGNSMDSDLYRYQLDYEELIENIEEILSGKIREIKPIIEKGKIVGQEINYIQKNKPLCSENALRFVRSALRIYLNKNIRSSKFTDYEISNITIGIYERLYIGLSKDLEDNGFKDLDELDFTVSFITDAVKASLNGGLNGFTFEGAIKRINIHSVDNRSLETKHSPPGLFGTKK